MTFKDFKNRSRYGWAFVSFGFILMYYGIKNKIKSCF